MRQSAAIGVAENNAVDIGLCRRLESFQRIVRVRLVAVEKVLGVVNHFADMLLEIGERIMNQLKIFLKTDPQSFTHMEVPGFTKNRNRIRPGRNQGLDIIVFLRGRFGAPGRTKGSNARLGQFFVLNRIKESDILGIGTRPSPLDVMNSHIIEAVGDIDLVLNQKRDILRLGSVTQGRIVQADLSHHITSSR